ncbi:sugar-binding protein [Ruminococcus sp.]|uniref:substrate-binding domain-containing protein n=1 Tax=Ruminococcus sp. TaxID=41978 RepID=UPI001B445CBC|nr:sugar-binding protein [Ruminococcus sp.]MBP5431768.1 sugar-binding protein [Ruminococcus sp.]
MKRIIAAVMSAVMLVSMTACGGKKESPEGSGKKTVGIAMPSVKLPRWNSDGDYLKSLFEKSGYEVKLVYSDNDSARQNNDIISMLNEDVDLLLIAAVDGKSLSASLDEAKKKEVPVVAYDRLIMNTNAVTYYVTFDNKEVGRMQGSYVRDKLDLDNSRGTFNIEFLSGDIADNNSKYVYDGAYEVLKDYIASGKVIIPSGMTTLAQTYIARWDTGVAKNVLKLRLNKYYSDTRLDAVICASDSLALGALEALDEIYKMNSQPIVTGQDGDVNNIKELVDGKQSMTIFKNIRDEASVALEVCKKILNGEVPTGKLVDSLAVDVTYDSESYYNDVKFVQTYLLRPMVITKENLQVMVNSGLYQWDQENKYLEQIMKE